MSESTESRNPSPGTPGGGRVRRAYALLVLVAAVIAAAWWGPTLWRIRQLSHADARVRRAAVRDLGGRDGHAAIPRIRRLITDDPDPAVREAAAHAAMKLNDRAAYQAICEAILSGPAKDGTAMMIADLARLAGPSPEAVAFVDGCGRSGKPYLVVGAATARAEWFQPRGITELLDLAASASEPLRGFIHARIRQYLIPPAEMLGVRFDTDDPWPPERLASMQAWWREHGSDERLRDALVPLRQPDEDLRWIGRLRYAREQVGRLLGLL